MTKTPNSSRRELVFDLITVMMVIASVILLGGTFLLISNPQASFNPFPVPTLPALLEIPSATPTSTATATFTPSMTPTATDIPPTETPSATPTPSVTPSPTSTATLSPTPVLPNLPTSAPIATGVPIEITALPGGPVPITPNANAEFAFSAGEPIYQRNLNSAACDWLSIAGAVTGMMGEPVLNLAVEIASDQFSEVHFSGTALEFGQSGFEVNLGSRPRRELFTVRLLDVTGEPLSETVFVETGDSCESNVAVIQFVQNRAY